MKKPKTSKLKKNAPKMINLAAAVGFGALAGAGTTYMFMRNTGSEKELAEEEQVVEPDPEDQAPMDYNLSEGLDFEEGPSVSSIDATNMTFEEAWEAAREEVGAGGVFLFDGGLYSTLTNGEWDALSPEEHAELWGNLPSLDEVQKDLFGEGWPAANEQELDEAPAAELVSDDTGDGPEVEALPEVESNVEVIVYENAPTAFGVDDDMSFSEAFATAREEVGAGGVFLWNGQMYGTYYETESASMTEEDRAAWTESIPSLENLQEHIAEHEASETVEPFVASSVEPVVEEELFAEEESIEPLEEPSLERSAAETEDPFSDLESDVEAEVVNESISASDEDVFDPEEDIKMDDSFMEEQQDDYLSMDEDISNDDDVDDFMS